MVERVILGFPKVESLVVEEEFGEWSSYLSKTVDEKIVVVGKSKDPTHVFN